MNEEKTLRQLEQQFIATIKELVKLIEKEDLDLGLLKGAVNDYLYDWRTYIVNGDIAVRYHFCLFLYLIFNHASFQNNINGTVGNITSTNRLH